MTLTSPNNVTRQLVNSGSCSGDSNWSFSLADGSTNAVNSAPFCSGSGPVGGNIANLYSSPQTLAVYNGTRPAGPWTLTVSDNNSSGTAPTLTRWGIRVCPQ
jgi:hypothetical protein